MLRTLLREAKLCYDFIRRDTGTGMFPIPGFTLVSSLYRHAQADEVNPAIAHAFLQGFLYLYAFVVSNQNTGVAEDRINKPDRPIGSGAESVSAAKVRYGILMGLYLLHAYYLGVEKWAMMWVLTTMAHNPLSLAKLGPAKDLCMGLGCIAQLKAAWDIAGSPPDMGWRLIKVITVYMLWPIPLQDLRDVPGDLAVGRRTTPILLGGMSARIYISAGILVSQVRTSQNVNIHALLRISHPGITLITIALSVVLALMTVGCFWRFFAFRSLTSDRFSYWLYTVIYVFQPLSACVTLR